MNIRTVNIRALASYLYKCCIFCILHQSIDSKATIRLMPSCLHVKPVLSQDDVGSARQTSRCCYKSESTHIPRILVGNRSHKLFQKSISLKYLNEIYFYRMNSKNIISQITWFQRFIFLVFYFIYILFKNNFCLSPLINNIDFNILILPCYSFSSFILLLQELCFK